ncbi:flavodoxin [Megasphaera elsdenii]|uniref:flavodoxin n=1 Tax=Megasphaera elsdenii TaxID=907 RepID=UPI001D0186EF|nr:flavodoxin [Megasphaera elsdenii]MCB5702328.1 flavodoxin [Megasphaera elsdenii]MCB5726623.1 flavodoxin [Megasphaera elsdenii]MCB5770402.1 flavodoxin [Megasphaera elsdenii]
MMKKILMLALSSLMVLGLAACGNTNGADASSSASKKTDTAVQAPAKGNGKTLVVYFSAGGHTKNVANYIAKATDGDVMELKPVQEYTEADMDYNNKNSRTTRERDDVSLRDVPLVKDKADNWEGYDTVFIGYPIWWGEAAWPVDNFIKHNDFSGKTVIPFATSASSGLGNSGKELQQMAGTGNWLEGKRFPSNASESDVQQWVQSLKR